MITQMHFFPLSSKFITFPLFSKMVIKVENNPKVLSFRATYLEAVGSLINQEEIIVYNI